MRMPARKKPKRAQTRGVKYGLILLVFFHPIFIPYPHSTLSGLGALPGSSPGFTWGYSNSTPTGLGPPRNKTRVKNDQAFANRFNTPAKTP
jgi:hypothetical protein